MTNLNPQDDKNTSNGGTDDHNIVASPIDSTRLNAFHQFMPLSVDKQTRILDRVAQDSCRYIYEDLLQSIHYGRAPINPEVFFRQACHIAFNAAASSKSAVLFSSTLQNRDQAEAYVNAHDEADVIYTTPVGWFLDRLELFNPALSPFDPEFGHILGYIASLRFAAETESKDVIAFVEGSRDQSTYRMVEIDALRENASVQTINGLNKSQRYDHSTREKLLEWVEAVSNSRTANDYISTHTGLSRKFNREASEFIVLPDDMRMRMRQHAVTQYLSPLLHRQP